MKISLESSTWNVKRLICISKLKSEIKLKFAFASTGTSWDVCMEEGCGCDVTSGISTILGMLPSRASCYGLSTPWHCCKMRDLYEKSCIDHPHICKPTHCDFRLFIATIFNPHQLRLDGVTQDWSDKYHVWRTPQGRLRGQTRNNKKKQNCGVVWNLTNVVVFRPCWDVLGRMLIYDENTVRTTAESMHKSQIHSHNTRNWGLFMQL